MADIIELDSPTNAFLKVPSAVYKDDLFYIPKAIDAVKASIARNDFIDKPGLFLAMSNGEPAGRLITRISPVLTDGAGQPIGMIGCFDAIEDESMIHALLDRAMAWFAERKVRTVIGPMDGDTWHAYRFNVGPWETPPFMMEPYNATYYSRIWESYGFEVDAGYHSLYVADAPKAAEALKKFYEHSRKRGFTFRNFDLNDYDSELSLLYQLSCAIFAKNYLYSAISEEAFKDLYAGSRAILNPDLIWFAFDKTGAPAGFVFCFPDYYQAQQSMRGKSHILAKARFLLNKGRADTLNIKTLGSVPAHRGSGLGPTLMYLAFQCGVDNGFLKANMCLIKDDNPSGRLDGGQGVVSRRYNLYRYEIQG